MKTLLSLILAFVTISAFAADPSGTWKWKAEAMGREIESTLQLTLKDGVLSGSIDNRAGKAEIKNASFNDGEITFVVERKWRKKAISTRYQGRLDGDSIHGTVTMSGAKSDKPATAEWHATRS